MNDVIPHRTPAFSFQQWWTLSDADRYVVRFNITFYIKLAALGSFLIPHKMWPHLRKGTTRLPPSVMYSIWKRALWPSKWSLSAKIGHSSPGIRQFKHLEICTNPCKVSTYICLYWKKSFIAKWSLKNSSTIANFWVSMSEPYISSSLMCVVDITHSILRSSKILMYHCM